MRLIRTTGNYLDCSYVALTWREKKKITAFRFALKDCVFIHILSIWQTILPRATPFKWNIFRSERLIKERRLSPLHPEKGRWMGVRVLKSYSTVGVLEGGWAWSDFGFKLRVLWENMGETENASWISWCTPARMCQVQCASLEMTRDWTWPMRRSTCEMRNTDGWSRVRWHISWSESRPGKITRSWHFYSSSVLLGGSLSCSKTTRDEKISGRNTSVGGRKEKVELSVISIAVVWRPMRVYDLTHRLCINPELGIVGHQWMETFPSSCLNS